MQSITSGLDAGKGTTLRRSIEATALRTPRDPAAQFALATLDRLTWHHRDAEARFAAIARTSPPVWRAWALLGLGATRTQRWDSSGVAVAWLGIAAADSLGEASAAAAGLLAQARFLIRFVRPDSVVQLILRARRMVPPADSGLLAAALCAEAGATVRSLGLPGADSLISRGLALATASRDSRSRIRCLVTSSQVAGFRGRQLVVSEILDTAVVLADSIADADLAAIVRQQRSFHRAQFSFALADARTDALAAIAKGTRSGNLVAVGFARLNLAQVAIKLGDYRAARRELDSAAIWLTMLGDGSGLASMDFVAGDASFAVGRLAEAERAYLSSMNRYRGLGSPVTQISLRLATVAIERGNLSRADSILKDAAGDANRFNLAGIKHDLVYYQALLALKSGRLQEAAAGFRRFRGTSTPDSYMYLLDAGIREAEALAGLGRLAEAESVADSAFGQLEAARQSLVEWDDDKDRDLVVGLAASRRYEFDPDLGVATVVDRLASVGREAAAFRLAEAQRGRTLWVRMALRRMLRQDAARTGRTNLTLPSATPLADLQRALDPGTAVFQFTSGAGHEPTTLIVVERSSLRAYWLGDGDSLAPRVQRLVDLIEGGGYPKPLARELSRILIDSAMAELSPSVRRLVVLPDGPLHRLPLDPLILRTGRPLVEQYAVSTAPSARIAIDWLSVRDAGAAGPTLAFGDPRFDARTGLRRLPGSAREAEAAAGRDGTVLLGANASEAAIKHTSWNGIGVLHLATHARTEDWGILSAAVHLSPGRGEDGRLQPEEITALRAAVPLVVLSGCRTIGGVAVFGEGVQGLVAPFIEGGARSVLATYWELGDRRIVPLVERLYAELRAGRTVGEAIHAAKRAALAEGEPPAVWAAFGLTGNPDIRPKLAR